MTQYFCDRCKKEVKKVLPSYVKHEIAEVSSGGFQFELCADCALLLKQGIHDLLADYGHSLCPDCPGWAEKMERNR